MPVRIASHTSRHLCRRTLDGTASAAWDDPAPSEAFFATRLRGARSGGAGSVGAQHVEVRFGLAQSGRSNGRIAGGLVRPEKCISGWSELSVEAQRASPSEFGSRTAHRKQINAASHRSGAARNDQVWIPNASQNFSIRFSRRNREFVNPVNSLHFSRLYGAAGELRTPDHLVRSSPSIRESLRRLEHAVVPCLTCIAAALFRAPAVRGRSG